MAFIEVKCSLALLYLSIVVAIVIVLVSVKVILMLISNQGTQYLALVKTLTAASKTNAILVQIQSILISAFDRLLKERC